MLKDPLVYLSLLGAALYFLYAALNPVQPTIETDTIVLPALTPALIRTQLTQNPNIDVDENPAKNAAELRLITETEIKRAIHEEILLRQAYHLQLFDDAMIRERLINKAKFALEDSSLRRVSMSRR